MYDTIGWKCYWQKPGQTITGVAYSWGNTDSISEFDQRISNGEPAGQIHSRYHVSIKKDPEDPTKGALIEYSVYSKFAGIDCSGFVSILWGYTKATRKNTKSLLNVSYRIPIWDAQQGDAWDCSKHVKWVSSFDGTTYFDGYEATPPVVTSYRQKYSDFIARGYVLIRHGTPTKPNIETIATELSSRNSKSYKFKVSDQKCGECEVAFLIPDLTYKLIKDNKKEYKYPKDALCFEGIKLPKQADSTYARDIELSWQDIIKYLGLSATSDKYSDGKYEIVIKTRILSANRTFEASKGNFDEKKLPIIINNYKPKIHDIKISSKGSSVDNVAKINDFILLTINFTEQIRDDCIPQIQLEAAPGKYIDLIPESYSWQDNTIDGIMVKHSSFTCMCKIPGYKQTDNSKLEKMIKISQVSGWGTDDIIEDTTQTEDGKDITVYADLDPAESDNNSVLPSVTQEDAPQNVSMNGVLTEY